MSVSSTEVIDAVTVRDGWAVLSVHEFGEWDELEDPEILLERKLALYFDHVESARFQSRLHRVPVRVELVSREPVPEDVRAVCRRLGVDVVGG